MGPSTAFETYAGRQRNARESRIPGGSVVFLFLLLFDQGLGHG